ncbi:class I SAM-dependent methyltransferase [Nocardia sp. NPDC088792]|uniref:class I SAM-dependent methyltransferase n=1 Tax=Nocardia sp. NPDC088792 TaxID=3364332 RepID=UPI003806DEA9
MSGRTTPSEDNRRQLALTPVQETLVIPLHGRAVESRKPRGLLHDEQAVRIVDSIDYDFTKFDGGASILITALRACVFDAWTREFLSAHPGGTVVELGAGLSSRFDRLDNGTCRWFDLDLPEVIELRGRFFADTERRRMITASILDSGWLDEVAEAPGPYLFIAEGVLPYFDESEARKVLTTMVERFPGSLIAFDTCGRKAVAAQDRLDAISSMRARMRWACDTPRALADIGLTLRESRNLARTQPSIRRTLPRKQQLALRFTALLNVNDFANYRMNLFAAGLQR